MNLHIGGKEPNEDWKILNIMPGKHVDFVGDMSDLSQFEDDSCDKVYASHVLEHVHLNDITNTLTGIRRILKPGGEFLVSVPDWNILCHLFINPLASLEVKWYVVQVMMGGQINEFDYHHSGFNFEIMADFLKKAGFSKARRVSSFGLFNDTSDHKPYGFPISLNVIATK